MKTYYYELVKSEPAPCLRVKYELYNSEYLNSPEICNSWIKKIINFDELCEEYVF